MSYLPPKSLLHGVPYPVAECYGKPHILCGYVGKGVNNTELADGATCACCGRPASNAHHWPPKRTSPVFHLHGIALRPALIAVCGTGTTGCHNGWHGGNRFKALWRWDCDELAEEWWEGPMICGLEPHDPMLYRFGCWEVYDMEMGRIWEVRL